MRILNKILFTGACLLLLLGISGCGKSGKLTVVFPKIGSADAALLMTDSATVLIDTGEANDGDEILSLLDAYDRNTVDLLVISHYDKDHVGGAAEILEHCTVKRVIGSTSPKESSEMDDYRAALENAGLTEEIPSSPINIDLGDLHFEIDPPREVVYAEDQSNNASTVVTVRYQNTNLLFTGDAMDARTAEFTPTLEQNFYDLIKIPHHGRDTSTVSQLLPTLKDGAAAVITSSKKEPENQDVLDLLENSGFHAYLTRQGTLTVTSDGNSLKISQDR